MASSKNSRPLITNSLLLFFIAPCPQPSLSPILCRGTSIAPERRRLLTVWYVSRSTRVGRSHRPHWLFRMLMTCAALHPIPSTRGLEISLYPFPHLPKNPAMIGVCFASLFATITPITMHLLGLLPPTGTSVWFAIIFVFTFIAATLGLSGFLMVSSIMADVV